MGTRSASIGRNDGTLQTGMTKIVNSVKRAERRRQQKAVNVTRARRKQQQKRSSETLYEMSSRMIGDIKIHQQLNASLSTFGGFVYYIQADSGPIKIGHAADPTLRIGDLQVGSWDALTLLAAHQEGEPMTERELHKKFSDDWIRGEWFQNSDCLLEHIEEHRIDFDIKSSLVVSRDFVIDKTSEEAVWWSKDSQELQEYVRRCDGKPVALLPKKPLANKS